MTKSTPESDHLKIRRARLSDATELADLSGQLGYPATPTELRARLTRMKPASLHAVFVAEFQKRVVGWLHVSVSHLLETPLRAEVNGLVVSEKHRSQGAGAKLLAIAEDWARKKKCTGVSVRSNVIRERAHQFYERNGYQHIKTQKAFRKPL